MDYLLRVFTFECLQFRYETAIIILCHLIIQKSLWALECIKIKNKIIKYLPVLHDFKIKKKFTSTLLKVSSTEKEVEIKTQDYTHRDHSHLQFCTHTSNTSQLACKGWQKLYYRTTRVQIGCGTGLLLLNKIL